MTVQAYTLPIIQGSTLSITCAVTQGGVAFDLTGYTMAGKIRRTFSASAALQAITCTITNAAGGLYTLSLTATETAALTINTTETDTNKRDNTIGVYDVEITSGATITRIMQGTVTLSQEATK